MSVQGGLQGSKDVMLNGLRVALKVLRTARLSNATSKSTGWLTALGLGWAASGLLEGGTGRTIRTEFAQPLNISNEKRRRISCLHRIRILLVFGEATQRPS